jgi:RNA polymerase sigma-70 factor (ECF subfamily)
LIDFTDIDGLKRRDEQSFSSLIDHYSTMVFNLSLNILQNKGDAEDITQEIFTNIYLQIDQFKGESKITTWIYRITLNKCQEHIRAKSRKKRFGFLTTLDKAEFGSDLQANFIHPGVELENQERASILFAAIEKLPENQRLAFTMHKLDGIPYEEIAMIMDTSLSSVESLIFRARQNLKKLLSDYYEENER